MTDNETVLVAQTDYTVLFVDDDADTLEQLERLFSRENYSVKCISSGNEALKLLQHLDNVAVIVSDQSMPVMEGAEFLRLSRDKAPDAIRILATAHSDVKVAIAAINDGGISRYISKPWETEALIQTVRDNVRNYALSKENLHKQEIINAQNRQLLELNNKLRESVQLQTSKIRSKLSELLEYSKQQ